MARALGAFLLILSLSAVPVAAQEPATTQELGGRVAEFIRGSHDHGVPYSTAREFGPAALPYLREWLGSDALKQHWTNIIWTIGYIGEPEDFVTIRTFIDERFSGEIDDHTFNSMLAAVHVLGHLSARSDAALGYLHAHTNPAGFANVKWTFLSFRDKKRNVLLSKFAINALSLTGRPEVKAILEKLRRDPYDQNQVSNINEALLRHEEVMRRGREQYLKAVERRAVKL